ncbi:MAG: hypothetical protein ACE5GW_04610, partial [Planctomycetota bacterium]
MKRFSFFLAVFSVGLVVFLLLTGQFGKLFRAGEENGDGSSASRQEEPEETRNVVTYYNHDYEKGRVRFSLRGVVDGSSSLKLNLDNISSQRSLSDAVLEIPIYGDEARNGEGLAPGLESLSRFVLRAERVWSSLESRSISLAGEITGEGDGGIPRLQTTALDLSWERGGD